MLGYLSSTSWVVLKYSATEILRSGMISLEAGFLSPLTRYCLLWTLSLAGSTYLTIKSLRSFSIVLTCSSFNPLAKLTTAFL